VLDERRVAIPSGNDIKTFDIANDFELLWQFGAGTQINTSLALNKFPNQDTQRIYFVSDTSVYALNANNGLLTWKRSVTGAKRFNSSICAPNQNYLYVGNDNGRLYAFNSIDGSTKFSYKTNAEIHSSPISVGGNVMVGSNDRTFYSVDSATGLLRWKVQTGDRILSSPYVYDQNVYFGSNDFNLYNVNIIDGTLRWKNLTFGTIVTSPLVYNDILYYNGHDQNVYAVDAKTGKAIWTYNTNGTMTSSMLLDNVSNWVVPSISGNSKY
jgi:outer membrane protein assembly factor BamB